MQPLNIPAMQYRAMIGVGGIGSGAFFALSGNHTLGREESRGGRFLDRRDYCKLHIISHYVQTLAGQAFTTIPIGKVGADDAGRKLLDEMMAAGLDMRYVESISGEQTLYSFCFIYPDTSGGNMTTEDSACSKVDAASVRKAEGEFARFARQGIVLAAPEVPLAARAGALKLGTEHGFFRAASFTSGEVAEALAGDFLDHIDLLALNVDEAAAFAGISAEGHTPEEVVEAAVVRLRAEYPSMVISITAGKDGSRLWDGTALHHVPTLSVPVAGTGGAGDAFLSGLLVGRIAGLSWPDAQHLATLVAALSVTSPHTIHPAIDRESLRALVKDMGMVLPEAIEIVFTNALPVNPQSEIRNPQ